MNFPDLQKWVEGEPAKTFWAGLKTHGKEAYQVQTFRCERCGWLESYANPE
jgi:ribosomal protein L37E